MNNFKSLSLGCAFMATAIVLLLSPQQTVEAQKTIAKNPFQQQQQQQQQSPIGTNQQAVYGGYQRSSSSSNRWSSSNGLVAPAAQRQTQQSFSSQRTEVSRQRPAAVIPQQQVSYNQEESSEESSGAAYDSSAAQAAEAQAEPASYGSVAGQPGRDFPAYTQVPKTSFSCSGLPYDYGMYADEETGCQAYHVCYNGRKDSFLCGVGTVFNQRILHCDYWYSVDCGKSSQYWSSNAYMGSSQPEPGPAEAGPPVAPGVYSQQASQSSYSKQSVAARRPSKVQTSVQSTYNSRDSQQQQQQQEY